MALSIRNETAETLAREVAARCGESMTQAIIHALEERLQKLDARRGPRNLVEEILEISRRCSSLPDLDRRAPDEILGYDDAGVSR